MARRIFLSGTVLVFTFLIFANLPVDAQGRRSDSEVAITATATKPDASGKQVLTIVMKHNKGWHTYANPVGNEDFDSNKTVLSVQAKMKPLAIKVNYPTGTVHKDKVVGDYNIYEGQTQIQATVQRGQGDTSALEVSVRIIACHDKGVCLLPATVRLTVP
jgi:DsbC/DsbD-like thiol-disulfide interchange protein